ncbi:hypothetical protein EUZ85_18685 [Hahella sp. KA22]|uniref:hypothetical protein n=1 Tax=Hahella sp. KA22 TaxID=1628392 RepID=UPI000FDE7AC4|nr:hypothetical protein [Hahella sp. KA22]AZZ92640.1 hypothetical protein ENC22_16110 [Hahella sp. KA22]QAY56013.1 hypothetical protein EUZ85_18685 [Hahella sp. KA22]
MKDPWNPITEELREWAFDVNALWPTQDFDLAVAELYLSEIILELASDDNCPKQRFFLKCAYIIVGDAVRTEYHTESKEDVMSFIDSAEKTGNSYLLKFIEQSKDLMQNPSKFDYDQWCDGGLAYAQFKG